MITVEELIVQSLYHRLVLIKVRRTLEPQADGGDGDTATAGTLQTVGSQSTLTDEAVASSEGLGYLCLGGNSASSGGGSSEFETLSAGSQALVNSIRESGEEVKVVRNVHTLVDTGDLQLMHASCCSAEVQTDFEPMWCFQSTPVSVDTEYKEMTVSSGVLPVEGSRLIDLRNCSEFSIVHLEDMRDPSSQFVMLETDGANEVPTVAAADNNTIQSLPASCPHADIESVPETPAPVPVEIIGAPALFVGGSGRNWKRELELSTESEGIHQPADVDSGIWDMMQALSMGADDSVRSEHFQVSVERPSYSEPQADPTSSVSVIQPSLQGVYKMFQIADGSGATESSVSDEQVPSNLSHSKTGSGIRQSSGGGLEDALEPVAVVDFIVHRVQAENVRLERVDYPESKITKEQHRKQRMIETNKSRRTAYQKKLLVDGATGVVDHSTDYSDGSYEDEEVVHRSYKAVDERSDRPSTQTLDTATNTPRLKKKHKDVVRVTSARFGRMRRRRVGGRGRDSWKDPNCEVRKSISADVSRTSSLLDINDGHQEMVRSSEAFSDPSPARSECRDVKTVDRSVLLSRQHFTSSPYEWRHPGAAVVDSHEWYADGSSSAASAPMTSGLGLLAEPDLLNFEKFPDWMRDLPEALLHVPLSDICIPGSHIAVAIERDLRTDLDFSKCNYEMADFLRKLPDLALFNNFRALMKTIWKAWMPKQCLSIYEQLVAGARYLDMRVTKLGGMLHGEHGLYAGALKAYLRDIRRFVEEHTSEVVILHFQDLEYLDRADKRQLVTTLFQAFGARMACSSMLTPAAGSFIPSLKQLRSGEKQIMIFFPSSDMEVIRNHIFGGLVWSDESVRVVASPKTQTVAELAKALDSGLAASGVRSASADSPAGRPLHVVKAVLSPDMSMVFGRYEFRSMRELVTYEASPAISRWINRKVGLNVVAVDFIGVGDIVRQLLQLNSSRP